MNLLLVSFLLHLPPPQWLSLQLLPSWVLLYPDTVEFSVVLLLPMAPGIFSLLSGTNSHSFSFTLSSFPQYHSAGAQQLWGTRWLFMYRKGLSLAWRVSLWPLRTDWLNTFSDKNDLVIADFAITSGMMPWGTYFHYSLLLPAPLLWLLLIGKHVLSSPNILYIHIPVYIE